MSRIGNKAITLPAGVSVEVAAGNLVTVKGPKGELKMSILGPTRKQTQVEISLTDARACVAASCLLVRWWQGSDMPWSANPVATK